MVYGFVDIGRLPLATGFYISIIRFKGDIDPLAGKSAQRPLTAVDGYPSAQLVPVNGSDLISWETLCITSYSSAEIETLTL
jgi:hypothetical protein